MDVSGVAACPVDLVGQTPFAELALVAAGLVPHLPAHLVQRVGGPLDHVERVGAAHRIRALLIDDTSDPFGAVSGDVGDLCAPLGPEGVEEGSNGGLVAAHCHPHQWPGVVVDHDGQVLVVAFVGDLIDPDPSQAGERVDTG